MKKLLFLVVGIYLKTVCFAQLDSIIYGIARSPSTTIGPSTIFLAKINPTTGVVSNISTSSQALIEEMGNRTIDSKKNVFYFMGQSGALQILTGLSLSGGTISTIAAVSNSLAQFFSQMIYHCPDSTIYGLARGLTNPPNPGSGYIYLAKINPVTGVATNISPNSVGVTFALPNATIDTKKKIYYFQAGNNIMGLDLATGTVVTNQLMVNTNGAFFSEMTYNRSDSTIYGLARTASTASTAIPPSVFLAKVNPATGSVTNISAASVATVFNVYNATIDPFKKIFYFVDGSLQIKGLSLINGTVVSSSPMTNTQALFFDNMQFKFNTCQTMIYDPPPVSNFAVAPANRCPGATVTFTDLSTNNPNAWNWTVLPAIAVTINSSNSQNPSITFATAGNYTVSVVASNTVGAGNTYSQVITVNSNPVLFTVSSASAVCAGAPVTITASGATTYTWSNNGGNQPLATFNPSGPTIYTVTGNVNTCTASSTVGIVTFPSPNITVIGSPNLCSGNAANLSGSGAVTYTWMPSFISPFISITPTVTTTYTLAGTGSNGCVGTSYFTVNVNSLPSVNLVATNTVICKNSLQSALISASGANTYIWTPGNLSGNSITVTPAVITTYSCVGTDVNGCSNMVMLTVSVSLCTGIKSVEGSEVIYKVFPNPANDKLIITSGNAPLTPTRLEMIDGVGRVVLNQMLSFDNGKLATDINFAELAPGIYTAKFYLKEKCVQQSLIAKE